LLYLRVPFAIIVEMVHTMVRMVEQTIEMGRLLQ